MARAGSAAALSRSLRTYYGDPGRASAMDALYRRFLKPGDLAFDIGAHVGDRIAAFRRLGARAVAVEPQPEPTGVLRLLYRRDPDVVLVPAAAGDRQGEIALHVNRRNPTISTASAEFVQAAQGASGWEGEVWDESVRVPCLTLQSLVEQHGPPAFIKIDVEGLEDRVLAGLNTPVPALSFEFTTIARAVGERCLDRLEALGPHRFDYALGETQALVLGRWASAAEMRAILAELPHEANSGDVYAVLS